MLCGSSLNKEIEIQEKLFVEIYLDYIGLNKIYNAATRKL